METQLELQVKFLQKCNIKNYTIEDGRLIINGYLNLRNLTTIPDSNFLSNTTINGNLNLRYLTTIPDSNFLSNTTINGYLDLGSLTTIPDSNFLSNTTINGSLDLGSLTTIPDSNFLSNTTINGSLYLESLTTIPDSNFLSNTTINGYLYLRSLTTIPDSNFLSNTTINGKLYLESLTSNDTKILKNNIKQLEEGYNEEKQYCFFDNILSKVLKVSNKKEYTIYTTTTGFISQKDKYTSHGLTIKKSIQDLEFKIIADKLKKEPIKEDTIITNQYYRIITGACEQGVNAWRQANNIEVEEILAKELYILLEKTKAYGFDTFKKLVTF